MFDGRVIRTEEDTGAVLLVDDRYGEDPYPSLYPTHWSAIAQVEDKSLQSLEAFWNTVEGRENE